MTRQCIHPGCKTQPSYGPVGGKSLYCSTHAPQGYVSIRNKKCAHIGCKLHPNFGPEGGKTEYCKIHVPQGYENVSSKKCTHKGCKTRATFGPEGGKAEYCKEHSPCEYENVRSKKCAHKGCKKHPNFGLEGEKATHCSVHSKPLGMLDIKNKRCAHLGCKTQPSFGLEGGRVEYCSFHGKPLGMVDVKSKRCEHLGCKLRPAFGPVGGKPKYCKNHAPGEYEDVVSKRCNHEGCKKHAIYGIIRGKPTYCFAHKPNGLCYENVVKKRCPVCDLTLTEGSVCMSCTGRVRREQLFANILKNNGFDFATHDKRTECSGLRPDFVFDAGTHAVVLEYDELQHGRSGYKCELTRMKNLYAELGMERVRIIRFNPDSYKLNGIVHTEHENERHGKLFEVLKEVLETPPDNHFEIHYLFYDNSGDNVHSVEHHDPYDIS